MSSKPHKKFSMVIQTGHKAVDLVNKHPTIAPRLPAGTLATLQADLTALAEQLPGADVVHAVARSATTNQETALAAGYALASAVRTAAVRSHAPREVLAAYGVGQRVHRRVVRSVEAAIQQIVNRAEANPAEAAGIGILPKDIDALKQALAEIVAIDDEQEKLRATAPSATRERNLTGRRIMEATDRIAAAGIVEFAADANTRALFQALIGAGNPRATKPSPPPTPPAKEPGPPSTLSK